MFKETIISSIHRNDVAFVLVAVNKLQITLWKIVMLELLANSSVLIEVIGIGINRFMYVQH